MRANLLPTIYDPSSDASLHLWLDPTDTSTSSLQKVGGGAVANGNTVGTWSSKKGPTRNFTQWGSNALPTYVTNAINGLPALRFQSQLITTQDSVSAFDGIGGLTVMRVARIASGQAPAFDLSCLDPNTGFSDVTHWGLSGSSWFMNGWRRPRIDTFQNFSGDATSATNLIITGVWDWANAQATVYQSGVEGPVFKTAFGSAGNSAATSYALSVGGFAQQTGHTHASVCVDGYAGTVFIWLSVMTPDQLVAPHHYLRIMWGIN